MTKSLLSWTVTLGVLILGLHAAAQEQDMCKNFRLEAEIPANGLHAEGVVPVLVRMRNIGGKDFWMDSWSRDWTHLLLVVRDRQGQTVPYSGDYQNLLDEASRAVITANVSMPIASGKSIEYPLFLDRLFGLKSDEDYSLAVSRWCGSPDRRLEAEIVRYSTFAPQAASASSISIHLTTPESEYRLGWAVPVNVSVHNHGHQTVNWATTEIWSELPDEFAMGVEIEDASGKALTTVTETNARWKTHHYPRGGIGFVQAPANGLAEKNIALGNLYDLSQQGEYSARIVLVDATTNQRVESNSIRFTLRSADYFAGIENKKMIPPFMMSISHVPYAQHDAHIDPSSIGILMCNISDHEIWMHNESGDYAEILGPNLTAVSMTEEELKLWNRYNDPNISAVPKREFGHNWFQLAPHQAINFGVWTYEQRYDLSHPGRYRLRVYRSDEPDAVEGTKLANLPKVYSNWMNFEEPGQTGP